MEHRTWLSLHVYYASEHDRLLLECIRPLLLDLSGDRIAQHFYIRYGEGGPHIRLRLRPAAPRKIDEVRRLAIDHIDRYIAKAPAPPVDTRFAPHGPALNNVIREVKYEPELDRYGGRPGVEVAEDHFFDASDIALEILARTNARPAARNGIAMQLMLFAATAFFEDTAAASAFFMPCSARILEANGFAKEQRRHLKSRYDVLFRQQRSSLERLVAPHVRGTAAHSSDAYARWGASIRSARRRLEDFELLDHDELAWRTLASYTHLMLNRLGIAISEEAYLLHLLARTLEPQLG